MIAIHGQTGAQRDSPDSDTAAYAPADPASPGTEYVAYGMVVADTGFRLAA